MGCKDRVKNWKTKGPDINKLTFVNEGIIGVV
jgi:hypothetical protein